MTADDAPAVAADGPERETGRPATLLRRLASLVYEALLVVALVFVASLVFPGAVSGRLPGWARHVMAIYLVIVTGAYFTWFWSRGQTLAMRAWRLRVVDAAGRYPSVKRALGRYVAALVLLAPGMAGGLWLREHPRSPGTWALVSIALISLAWPLWDRERRALYDRIAGTRLIRLDKR